MTSINGDIGRSQMVGGQGAAKPKIEWRRLLVGTDRYAIVVLLDIALVVVFAIKLPGFLTIANFNNMLAGTAVLWIISLGMTFVVISGGIDLTVGAQIALSGIVLAKLLGNGTNSWLAIAIALLFSAACGAFVNGFLIGKVGLNFFVVTLATMTAFTGIVNVWSGSQTQQVVDNVVLTIGTGKINGIPISIWIMIVTLVIALYVQRWTYWGRDVYAVGGSLDAARLSGIRTSRTLIAVYAVSAVCAGLSAVIQVGQLGAASPEISSVLPLQAAAAVLLGGTIFSGGVGGVAGTAAGVLFIGILQNGLGLAGISSFWQQIVTGIILVLAVGLEVFRRALSHYMRRRSLHAAPSTSMPSASNHSSSGVDSLPNRGRAHSEGESE